MFRSQNFYLRRGEHCFKCFLNPIVPSLQVISVPLQTCVSRANNFAKQIRGPHRRHANHTIRGFRSDRKLERICGMMGTCTIEKTLLANTPLWFSSPDLNKQGCIRSDFGHCVQFRNHH